MKISIHLLGRLLYQWLYKQKCLFRSCKFVKVYHVLRNKYPQFKANYCILFLYLAPIRLSNDQYESSIQSAFASGKIIKDLDLNALTTRFPNHYLTLVGLLKAISNED